MATELSTELAEAIRLGYERRDRTDMAPTIRYFSELLAAHPDHPVLVYELGGAYDTAGQEALARTHYERALRLGLEGDVLRRCLCQYGSTLRWLGELDASREVLDRARREFPESDSVRVFSALTRLEAADADGAVAELLEVITGHADATDLGRWSTGLRGLAGWLAAGRPEG